MGAGVFDCLRAPIHFTIYVRRTNEKRANGRASYHEHTMSARCLLLLALLPAATARADGLRAGAAKVDITPSVGHAMWGYSGRRDAPSVGVIDRPYARALVLEAGSERIALVNLDLGRAPTRVYSEAIRNHVRKTAGVGTVFLVASHTHHGPVLEVDTWPNAKDSYARRLQQKLSDVIVAAARALEPARLGVASKETKLNRNRHSKRPEAPVDRQLLVLRVETLTGKPIAHAVNFAAHPTMLSRTLMKLSADYPGALAECIEKETKAPCLFLQGAAGDLSPNPPAGQETPEKFGRLLGTEVLAQIKGIRCDPLVKPTLTAKEEEFRFDCRVDVSNPVVKLALGKAFYPDLIAFFEREYQDGVRPRLTTALLDGRIGLVGVSGEFFCAHALHLKRRARLEHLFFLGYCNDYHQYFPTIEAAAEGGYGTEPWIAAAAIGSGEKVMDRALIHLWQMRGKLKGTK
jgi:neutral ceramidase